MIIVRCSPADLRSRSRPGCPPYNDHNYYNYTDIVCRSPVQIYVAFTSWLSATRQNRKVSATLNRIAGRFRNREMAAAWAAWLDYVEWRRSAKNNLTKAVRYMLNMQFAKVRIGSPQHTKPVGFLSISCSRFHWQLNIHHASCVSFHDNIQPAACSINHRIRP